MKIIIFLLLITSFLNSSEILANNRQEPVPVYGSYMRELDRSKQTFNGHLNINYRPSKQKENFFTVCKESSCVAYTFNLYAPSKSPAFIKYHWAHQRWELTTSHYFNCNDGSRIKSTLHEYFMPSKKGSFIGVRHIRTEGMGCPGEGSGTYRIPFKLIPI